MGLAKTAKNIADWINLKFPDKVVVTEEKFQAMSKAQSDLQEDMIKLQERLKAIENNLGNINMAMGFAAPKAAFLER